MSDKLPLVSVVTVCWNSAKSIRRTIESVLGQTYPKIEYIIVDGGSTDGTLDIINEFRDKITSFISGKDHGISDAFNKGLNLAKGEYVQILNSDDRLESHKIERSVSILETHPNIGFVFGDIVIENEQGERHSVKGNERYARSIFYTMPKMNHPTVLARKELYDRFGGFETKWKLAMDYDWLLRVHKAGIVGRYSDALIVYMNEGGLSRRNAVRAFKEVRDISTKYGFNKITAYLYFTMRYIKQFIYIKMGIR